MTCEWRPILGFAGLYEVNNLGQVRSIDRQVWCLAPTGERVTRTIRSKLVRFDRGGRNKRYQRCYLRDARGEKCHAYVHRLVCEAWHGPKPSPGMVIRHLNDVQTDNRPDNLAWGTPEENRADQIRNRTVADDDHADAELEAVGCSW